MMRISVALLGFGFLGLSFGFSQTRTPWIDSNVRGSPEPPPPFAASTVFPLLDLHNALELTTAPGCDRFFVIERRGGIRSFVPVPGQEDVQPVIQLRDVDPQVMSAYSLAFHPDWRENRRVFVTYTLKPKLEHGSRLSRFELKQLDPPVIDPSSETILLTWLSGGHNGAHLQFGPDGYLYMTTGDGEVPTPPDPRNTGQDISDLLSSVLRLDVDREEDEKAYAIPEDNPFLEVPNARPEVWAYGLRNPWKISFGPDGRLWCGDVGWELWEMIHLIERGGNYGWSTLEASQPVRHDAPPNPSPITPPVIAHAHTEAASITGGYVYTGEKHPMLQGGYIYGDYETGKIWALWYDGSQITRHLEIADTPHRIVTFGRAPDGEIYYLHFDGEGSMHGLVPNPAADRESDFPKTLSATGLFSDLAGGVPAPGIYEFGLREPMWQDGATARRWVAFPEETRLGSAVHRRPNGSLIRIDRTWPTDAVLAKTIASGGTDSKPIETQLMHFDGASWKGYTYRWRENGADADLVSAEGDRATIEIQGEPVDWRFHARAECDRCHTIRSGVALGFQAGQLAEVMADSAHADPVATLTALGLVDGGFDHRTSWEQEWSAAPPDAESKARHWLHTNCAHCHRQAAGGSAAIRLNLDQALAEMALVDEKPIRGELGIEKGRLVWPGRPWRSVLVNRVARTGAGHMPIIGPQTVDSKGFQTLWDWIESMEPSEEAPSAGQQLEDQRDEALLADLKRGEVTGQEEALKTLLSHVPGALRMIHAMEGESLPESIVEMAVAAGLASGNADVVALFDRFRPAEERLAVVGPRPDPEAIFALEGRIEEGRSLLTVTGKMAVCLGCHVVRGEGQNIGPELSLVGARLTAEQLLESLVEPSKAISEGYEAVSVDGQTGFVLGDDGSTLHLRGLTGETLTFDKTKATVTPLPISLMPEGLIQGLTPQELADLLAYLGSLKPSVEKSPRPLQANP